MGAGGAGVAVPEVAVNDVLLLLLGVCGLQGSGLWGTAVASWGPWAARLVCIRLCLVLLAGGMLTPSIRISGVVGSSAAT